MAETLGGLYIFVLLLLLLLVICWIVLPFAVIGTKPLLRRLIETQERTNTLLEEAARRTGSSDSGFGLTHAAPRTSAPRPANR